MSKPLFIQSKSTNLWYLLVKQHNDYYTYTDGHNTYSDNWHSFTPPVPLNKLPGAVADVLRQKFNIKEGKVAKSLQNEACWQHIKP